MGGFAALRVFFFFAFWHLRCLSLFLVLCWPQYMQPREDVFFLDSCWCENFMVVYLEPNPLIHPSFHWRLGLLTWSVQPNPQNK